MQGIPTLEEVRAWCAVSTATISDESLETIRAAEVTTQARLLRLPEDPDPGPVVLTLDDLHATVTVSGGTPGELYRLVWGDTYSDELTLDAAGDGELAHDYASAGDFTAVLYDDQAHALAVYPVTVPGNGTTAPQATYPPPLVTALLRRCQRAIAARALPLGMVGDTAGEYGASYLKSWDPEINRLENPFRIAVIA